jgi:hypothetical protein
VLGVRVTLAGEVGEAARKPVESKMGGGARPAGVDGLRGVCVGGGRGEAELGWNRRWFRLDGGVSRWEDRWRTGRGMG